MVPLFFLVMVPSLLSYSSTGSFTGIFSSYLSEFLLPFNIDGVYPNSLSQVYLVYDRPIFILIAFVFMSRTEV